MLIIYRLVIIVLSQRIGGNASAGVTNAQLSKGKNNIRNWCFGATERLQSLGQYKVFLGSTVFERCFEPHILGTDKQI
jgi:hypothetical protein